MKTPELRVQGTSPEEIHFKFLNYGCQQIIKWNLPVQVKSVGIMIHEWLIVTHLLAKESIIIMETALDIQFIIFLIPFCFTSLLFWNR